MIKNLIISRLRNISSYATMCNTDSNYSPSLAVASMLQRITDLIVDLCESKRLDEEL